MKRVLAILLCIGFFTIASQPTSTQQKPIIKSPTDTSRIKLKTPKKQTLKQKVRVKKVNGQEQKMRKPEPWENDRPLLMKEKEIDSLKKKGQ